MVAEHNQHCEQTLMFTDIVGYSRLMGRNEAMAIEMLGEYRKILLSHIETQAGQLVEFIGDAIFARFDSASSATAAAIAIQQHLQAFNDVRDKKLPPLQTRIGLHKGEVMLRDGAVFGDSVNIAARLEPLAVAEGICISQAVYDEVRFTLSSPAKRLGVQALKNIEQKIRVYLIKPSGIGWRDHLFYFLRGLNKKIHAYRYPLTACLLAFIVAGFYFIPRWLVPGYTANYVEIADFQNLMNEKGDADYFSAGITAAVRSQLADMRDVYIVDAKEGIHAPIRLEGSVQRLGDNLRIAYRLFRRKDNVQIAGGKLDGTYQDIFILQDRLVGEIARYLADEFDLQNFRPAPLKLTNDVTAYDYYLQGLEYLEAPTTHESVDYAVQRFNSALVHDEKFSLANTGLCEAYWKKYLLSNSVEWINNSERYCLLSLAQDNRSAKTYTAIGVIYRDMGRYDKAIEFLEKGQAIDPYNVNSSVALALTYSLSGKQKMAENLYLESIARFPKSWVGYHGYGYFLMHQGRYDDAIDNYEKVLKITPKNIYALNNIAANYMYKNNFSAAADALFDAAEIQPSGSIFGNTGNMYYLSGEYEKSVSMFYQALRLEPMNYEWIVNIADAYMHIAGEKDTAKSYCERAVALTKKEVSIKPDVAKSYYYLARSYACLRNLPDAKKALMEADALNVENIDGLYAHLRVAVLDEDEESIKHYVKKLINAEYSYSLILADPEFAVLKEKKFHDVFSR
ncbi:MAG: adenylate cyclase [Cellvibrio sp.]|nr:adenylate cyclase [Cellvibrio sp.]